MGEKASINVNKLPATFMFLPANRWNKYTSSFVEHLLKLVRTYLCSVVGLNLNDNGKVLLGIPQGMDAAPSILLIYDWQQKVHLPWTLSQSKHTILFLRLVVLRKLFRPFIEAKAV